jgi:hypothetical protein
LRRHVAGRNGWLPLAIASPGRQAQERTGQAVALGCPGDLDEAEAAARFITDPGRRAQALADVAVALARSGDPGRADLHNINPPDRNADPTANAEAKSSQRARQLLASLLVSAIDYVPLLSPLAKVEPTAVIKAAKNIRA